MLSPDDGVGILNPSLAAETLLLLQNPVAQRPTYEVSPYLLL